MTKPSPLEILLSEFLPSPVEEQVAKIREPPAVVALGSLRTPVYGEDPNELLKHRFVYRGALALLCGPTGIGKSSLLLQAAVYWAVGRAFFGIEPGEVYQRNGMRILIVQAENDEGDLAEMRNGVMAGCDDLTDGDKALAGERIWIATVTDKSAEAFAGVLEALILEGGPYDLVIVDPAFAYLGGDSNSQRDVSHFMRELLNPLAHRHQVGVILAHHTNKPLRGKEKDSWAAGDFAYLGAGSAEWINPARAALALRSIGSDTVFEFRGAKRGKRLRWVDGDGNPTTVQHIAHHRETGVICWRRATAEELAELAGPSRGGRPRQYDDIECLHAVVNRPGETQGFYLDLLAGALGCAKETVRKMLKTCVDRGWIAERGDHRFRRYQATEKGVAEAGTQPSTRDWTNHQPERQG